MPNWRDLDKAELIEHADRLGHKLDGRKGLERLQEELAEMIAAGPADPEADDPESDEARIYRLEEENRELREQLAKTQDYAEMERRKAREHGYQEGLQHGRQTGGDNARAHVPDDIPEDKELKCLVVARSVYLRDSDVSPPTAKGAATGSTKRLKGQEVRVRNLEVVRQANQRGEVLRVLAVKG